MGRYTEILKLKEMLEKANIPFTFTDDFFGAKKRKSFDGQNYPAYQIRLNKDIDVVQHFGSYGEDKNLLEIMGGLTEEEQETDSVLGYLTAEEVFKRFKYCYENGTAVYKAEKPEIKTEQEQINKLAMILCKHIRDCGEIDCKTCPFKGCMSQRQAKEILDRGYRKASEVIDEFVERINLIECEMFHKAHDVRNFCEYKIDHGNTDDRVWGDKRACDGKMVALQDFMTKIKKLADEMRKEVSLGQ